MEFLEQLRATNLAAPDESFPQLSLTLSASLSDDDWLNENHHKHFI